MIRRRLPTVRAGFGVRLAATLLAALATAAAVAYPLLSHALEQRLLRADWQTTRALAAAVRAQAGGDPRRPEVAEELDEALGVIAARPGTHEAKLIGPGFGVAASADPADVGGRDYDASLGRAIGQGRAYFGRESDPEADTHDFEYIVPLRIAGDRYAFEITRDDAFLNAQLSAVRAGILVAGVLGLLAALIAFWPLGGRRLLRMHRLAVERGTLDGLTQLGNHRAFQDELGHAVARAGRYGDAPRNIDELIEAAGPRIHAGQGYGLGRPAADMPAGRLRAAA
jgi:hypothetical protein